MKLAVQRAAIGAGAAALVYRLTLDRYLARWGATRDEWAGELPGDEVVAEANHQSTRAVEVDAEPAEVWPWLVQIGQGRGGLYSYDWLENVFRLDIHSTDRIMADFQDLSVGDTIAFSRSGEGPKVRELDPQKLMLLEATPPPWTWAFVLRRSGSGRTRLVVRNRISTTRSTPWVRLLYIVLGPAVFIMERKMLLGIKERAERLHARDEALAGGHGLVTRQPEPGGR